MKERMLLKNQDRIARIAGLGARASCPPSVAIRRGVATQRKTVAVCAPKRAGCPRSQAGDISKAVSCFLPMLEQVEIAMNQP